MYVRIPSLKWLILVLTVVLYFQNCAPIGDTVGLESLSSETVDDDSEDPNGENDDENEDPTDPDNNMPPSFVGTPTLTVDGAKVTFTAQVADPESDDVRIVIGAVASANPAPTIEDLTQQSGIVVFGSRFAYVNSGETITKSLIAPMAGAYDLYAFGWDNLGHNMEIAKLASFVVAMAPDQPEPEPDPEPEPEVPEPDPTKYQQTSCDVSGTNVVTLAKNFGFTAYKTSDTSLNGKIINACKSTWQLNNSKDPTPENRTDCDVGSLPINRYPISLNGLQNVQFVGGIVDGMAPQNQDFKAYCNSAAFIAIDSSKNIVADGIRISKVWDGVRMARDTDNVTYRNIWLSEARDDCSEDDIVRTVTFENSIFDGCTSAFSFRPGAEANDGSNSGTGRVLTLDGMLVRMHAKYHAKKMGDTPTHNAFFKLGSGFNMTVKIKNTVLAAEATQPLGMAGATEPHPQLKKVMDLALKGECSGNYFLWLGAGPIPAVWSKSFPTSCFKLLEGQAAQNAWQKLKTNWINCHPKNVRFSTDPASNANQCVKGTILQILAQ